MTYVEGALAAPRSKRLAVLALGVLAALSFCVGALRQVRADIPHQAAPAADRAEVATAVPYFEEPRRAGPQRAAARSSETSPPRRSGTYSRREIPAEPARRSLSDSAPRATSATTDASDVAPVEGPSGVPVPAGEPPSYRGRIARREPSLALPTVELTAP